MSGDNVVRLSLVLEPVVVGVKTHNSFGPGETPAPTPWGINHGMFSELTPFWSIRIQPIQVGIEQSTWVRDILPALGYNRRRLLEITFPPTLPDHASAAAEWDKAQRALDEHRYDDCIAECRDLLAMWHKQLGASKIQPVAAVIAGRRGWDDGDGRRALLDGLWKAVVDLANTTHHPEGTVVPQQFTVGDARLLVVLTAAISEYVADKP